MNVKTFILRGVVATVIHFILGFLLYAVIFAKYLQAHMGPASASASRPVGSELVGFIFLSCLSYGFLLSYVFTSGASQSLKQGLLTGAITGFLYASAVNANLYATTNLLTIEVIVADTLMYAFMSTVMGWVISFIGKTRKTVAIF